METKHIVLVVIGAVIILALVYKANCKKCNGVKTVVEPQEEAEEEGQSAEGGLSAETETETNTGTQP